MSFLQMRQTSIYNCLRFLGRDRPRNTPDSEYELPKAAAARVDTSTYGHQRGIILAEFVMLQVVQLHPFRTLSVRHKSDGESDWARCTQLPE